MSAPHVLVVEDDPSVRGLLHTLLAATGLTVMRTAHRTSITLPDISPYAPGEGRFWWNQTDAIHTNHPWRGGGLPLIVRCAKPR